MGRHSAAHLPVRDLRRSYNGLREAYERLLRDHRRLEAEHRALLDTVPHQPSTEVELWRPATQTTWGRAGEAMGVDAACTLVREIGLLASAGLEG